MAKITIMGDMIQIKTELTKSDVDRVKTFAPETLKLFDNDGNEVFGVDMGDACYSKYGVCFCSEDSNGKLFMSTNNPVCDHSDPEAEKEEVTKHFALLLNKLNAVEANVQNAAETLSAVEAEASESVVFAG